MSSSSPQLPDIHPCLEWDPQISNPYGYHPSLAWGITFTVLFIGSFGMHCWQAYKYRKWWLLAFSMGALGEVSGWVSRIASHKCPYSVPAFEAQLASLITGMSLSVGLSSLAGSFKSTSPVCHIIMPLVVRPLDRINSDQAAHQNILDTYLRV